MTKDNPDHAEKTKAMNESVPIHVRALVLVHGEYELSVIDDGERCQQSHPHACNIEAK